MHNKSVFDVGMRLALCRLSYMLRDDILRISCVQLILWSCFFYAFSVSIPMISVQTGWEIENLFLALTLSFSLWALFSPVAGYFVDSGRALIGIRFGILTGAILLLIVSVSRSEYVVYVCIILLGIPMAFTLYEPFFAFIMRRCDAKQASSLIWKVTLIAGLATLFVYPTIVFLDTITGWHSIFMVFFIFMKRGCIS